MSKYILPEGVEAKQETLTLWKGKSHYFHEKDFAEYELAIGYKCRECGKDTGNKNYLLCPSCKEEQENKRYFAKDFKEWDGKTPLVIFDTDIYLNDKDDIIFHCEDNNIESEDLHLMICEKTEIPTFDISHFIDDEWDWDYDIPNEDRINAEVNEVIQKYLTKHWNIWHQGKYRTRVVL